MTSGCSLPLISDLTNFVDEPFGDVGTEVAELDGETLGPVMSAVLLRFRSYIELREAISFAALDDDDACISSLTGTNDDFRFVVDLGCLFGSFGGASGAVDISQRQTSSGGDPVVEVDVEYLDAVVGDLEVSGTESVVETATDDGSSVRTLDSVQNGFVFQYAFRLGQLDPETPVFDYSFELDGGPVSVRLTNPVTAGSFASVLVAGTDGVLTCDIRNAAWVAGDEARGTCDNGAVFGLD